MYKLKRDSYYNLLLLLVPLIFIMGLSLLGFDGLFGQDSYEYLRYTKNMLGFLSTGEFPGDFFWPKGYPLIGAVFSFVFPSYFALQLVSLVSLYGVFYYAQKLLEKLYQESKDRILFVSLALLFSPYVLRNALIVGSDTLAMFCFFASVYYSICFRQGGKTKMLSLSIFFGVFAVFTRYAAFIPLIVLLFFLTFYACKQFRLSYLVALIAPLILVYFHLYFESYNADFVQHEWLINWSLSNFYQNEFDIAGGIRQYTFPNLIYSFLPLFHAGFFWLNILMCYFIVRNKSNLLRTDLLLLSSIILSYAIFLAGIPFQNNRFLLLTYPIFLVLLYPGFHTFNKSLKKYNYWVISLLIIMQFVLFIRAFEPTFRRNSVEKEIVEQLESYQNQTLYSFDIDVALMGRGLDFNYQNLWEKEYKEFVSGSLVLFNEIELSGPWEGKTPMINWNKLKATYNLELIKELPQGWELYQINE